jgi:hypothetical protein
MTKNFDLYCEQIINEYLTSKSKRSESRYWKPTLYPKLTQVRKVASNNASGSQATKQGNRQYVGNAMGPDGIRQNKSEKDLQSIGISKGLGGIIRPDGVNPKQVGASINSKQGDMIVKHVLSNGKIRVGSRGKRNYGENMTQMRHLERRRKMFGN